MARLIMLDSGPLGLIVASQLAACRPLSYVAQYHIGKRRYGRHS